MSSSSDVIAPELYSDIGGDLQRGLASLRQDEVCTDFQVIVQGESFTCHKAVLAAMSDFFRAMFQSGMQETVRNETVIDNVSPETFRIILSLLYYKQGDPDPLENLGNDGSDTDLKEMILAADMLQMNFLTKICLKLLPNAMNVENCVEIWTMCKTLSSPELGQLAFNFLVQNFENEMVQNCLITLNYEEIKEVVSSPNLEVTNEVHVWQVISKWIDFDKNQREERLPELLGLCCLTEIQHTVLTEKLAFEEKIRLNAAASVLVQKAIKFKNHPGDSGNILDLKFRKCAKKEQVNVMLVVREGQNNLSMYIPIPVTDYTGTRSRILPTGLSHITEFACCVHDCDMYLCGGKGGGTMTYNINSIYKCSLSTGKVHFQQILSAKMNRALKRHAMVATDTSLFTVGGVQSDGDLNSQVLEYSISSNKWTVHGELLAPVENASAVHVNGNIYMFGGVMNSEESNSGSDIIQKYDISTKTATILPNHLPSPCDFSFAAVKDDQIIVVTCNGDIVRLSETAQDSELIATIPDFGKRKYFGMYFRDDKINILGGVTIDQGGNEDGSLEVFVFDMKNRCTNQKLLKNGLSVYGNLRVIVKSPGLTTLQV